MIVSIKCDVIEKFFAQKKCEGTDWIRQKVKAEVIEEHEWTSIINNLSKL